MGLIIASRRESLIEKAVGLLNPEGCDYSKNLVVFPGRRPAHFLRKALADSLKGSFIPPKIFSIEDLVDYLYEEEAQDRKIDSLEACSILYSLHLDSSRRIGKDTFLEVDRFFPVGMILFKDLEDLYIEGISIEKARLISMGDVAPPESSMNVLDSLAYYYAGFYKRLPELGYSTRSVRFRWVSENISRERLESFKTIIFAGFFGLTKAESALFCNLQEQKGVHLLFKEGSGLRDNLQKSGLKINTPQSAEEIDAPASLLHIYRCPDVHSQVVRLSGILQGNVDYLKEDTVVVMPNPQSLFPLIRHGLGFLSPQDYNISAGYPLDRTPIYDFFMLIFELWTNSRESLFYLPDYLNFIMHPYVKNYFFYPTNPEPTRILLHYLHERLASSPQVFLSLQAIEDKIKPPESLNIKGLEGIDAESLCSHLRHIHSATIEKFSGFSRISHFARVCSDLVVMLYENTTAAGHPFFYPFCESFLDALRRLEASIAGEIVFQNINSYFNFFRTYLKECRMPFKGEPLNGLQTLGFLETRGLHFKRIFILQADEDVLPGHSSDNSLIPQGAKTGLGLSTYRDRDAIVGYYFDCLTGSAEDIHVFCTENDRSEPSRFVTKLIWQRQKEVNSKEESTTSETIQYRVRLDSSKPEAIEKNLDMISRLKDIVFSPSGLDEYLRCQLSFYYHYVLGLSEKDEPHGEINAARIGTFVHRLLFEYFAPFSGRRIDKDMLDLKKMQGLCNKLFREHFGTDPSGAAYLIMRQVSVRLQEFLGLYLKSLCSEEDVRILFLEKELKAPLGPFYLKGKLDALWERGHRACIVDYKTSANSKPYDIDLNKLSLYDRGSWRKAIGSFQLPIYLLLYAYHSKRPLSELDAMFIFIGKAVLDRNAIESCLSGQEIIKSPLEEIIVKLLQEIVDQNHPFMPPEDFREACKYCGYITLCNTQWIL